MYIPVSLRNILPSCSLCKSVGLCTKDIVYFKTYIHFDFLPQHNKHLNRCFNRLGCSRTYLTVRLLWRRWERTWRPIRWVMGEIFPGAKQKGREVGVLFPSRTEVQNASMTGMRIHLHTLHNKIGKTKAGMDRISSTKIVICEVPCFVYPDIGVSRCFTLFHDIPPYVEIETGTYLKLSQPVTSTPLPNQ